MLDVIITSPDSLTISLITTNACSGFNNGAIDLEVSGGTPGYTYLWNTGLVDEDLTDLAAGTYSVTVTDTNSCTSEQATSVNSVQNPSVDLGDNINECEGTEITLNAGSGYAGYIWNTGDTTESINIYSGDIYSVTITNSNGCSDSDSIQFIIYDKPPVSLGPDTNISFNTTVTLNAGGGGTTYLWSTGATSQSITVSDSGTYYVVVTNNYGCTNSDTIVIIIDEVTLHPYNLFTPNGDGVNDTWVIDNIEYIKDCRN